MSTRKPVAAKKGSNGKVSFELEPNDVALRHEDEISKLLEILGHPEAIVTDETPLSFFHPDADKMDKIRRLSKVRFGSHALLVQVAAAVRKAAISRPKRKEKENERG